MIRQAAETDIDDILSLCEELEECVFPADVFSHIYKNILENKDHVVLLYEEEGSVCGFLHMRMEYQMHHCARIAEILELDVRAERRSEGIGKELFTAACEQARREDCVQIELVSNRRRADAHRFYETKGMVRTHYGFTMPL